MLQRERSCTLFATEFALISTKMVNYDHAWLPRHENVGKLPTPLPPPPPCLNSYVFLQELQLTANKRWRRRQSTSCLYNIILIKNKNKRMLYIQHTTCVRKLKQFHDCYSVWIGRLWRQHRDSDNDGYGDDVDLNTIAKNQSLSFTPNESATANSLSLPLSLCVSFYLIRILER